MTTISDDAFVRLFQERARLMADGIAGRDTLAKLDALLPPRAASAPAPVPSPPAPGRFALSSTSRQRLGGVHPDLVKVIERAIRLTPVDFIVLEGMRTLARQRQLVAAGASKTMNSRHLTGHAVDIAPLLDGKVSWDWPLYHRLAPAVKQAATEVGVPIEWGGDWRTFKDGPHWQLPFARYPK